MYPFSWSVRNAALLDSMSWNRPISHSSFPTSSSRRVPEQVGQERVGVEDPPGRRIDEQDAVLGRLEQPAVAGLGERQGLGRPPPVGHVLDGQQDQPGPAAGRGEPAGVEHHRPAADALELVVHLEVVEVAVPREDLFEQLPQPGDVPLAVPQLEEGPALGLSPGSPGTSGRRTGSRSAPAGPRRGPRGARGPSPRSPRRTPGRPRRPARPGGAR